MAWPYIVHLDRMMKCQGELDGNDTIFYVPTADTTLNAIVLGPDFGSYDPDNPDDNYAGKVITPDSVQDGIVRVNDQDLTAGEVIIGRKFTATCTFSRPYFRDVNNNADIDAFLLVRQLTTAHRNSGSYKLQSTMRNRPWNSNSGIRTATFTPWRALTEREGFFKAWFQGKSDKQTLAVTDDGPAPFTISAVEIIADYIPRGG